MQEKLTWNAIGYENKFETLLETVNNALNTLPADHTRDFQKLNKFRISLEAIIEKNRFITTNLIPKIEKTLRINFKTPELILIALTRPNIRHLIDNIETHFEAINSLPFSSSEFKELSSSGDASDVLALIGDSVLDLAIVNSLWDSSLAKVGVLTKRRSELVNNKNLAKLCDKLGLYENRILGQVEKSQLNAKEDKINHEKGTLVESLFGVIYLEHGLDELGRIIPFLQ